MLAARENGGCPAAPIPFGCSPVPCDGCAPVCLNHCDCGRQSGGKG
jgi:hypothetical protein